MSGGRPAEPRMLRIWSCDSARAGRRHLAGSPGPVAATTVARCETHLLRRVADVAPRTAAGAACTPESQHAAGNGETMVNTTLTPAGTRRSMPTPSLAKTPIGALRVEHQCDSSGRDAAVPWITSLGVCVTGGVGFPAGTAGFSARYWWPMIRASFELWGGVAGRCAPI